MKNLSRPLWKLSPCGANIYQKFHDINFAIFFEGEPTQERDAYIEEAAKRVWEIVAEAMFPTMEGGST